MNKRIITAQEFKDMSIEERKTILLQETEFKEFETAIRVVGELVNKDKYAKKYWQILKKRLNRDLTQIIIQSK